MRLLTIHLEKNVVSELDFRTKGSTAERCYSVEDRGNWNSFVRLMRIWKDFKLKLPMGEFRYLQSSLLFSSFINPPVKHTKLIDFFYLFRRPTQL